MTKLPVVHGASSAVGALLHNDKGEYLLQFRNFREDEFPGLWTLPGGKIGEDGELYEIMTRLREELCLRTLNEYKLNHVSVTVANSAYVPVELTLFTYPYGITHSMLNGVDNEIVPAFGFFSFEDMQRMAEQNMLHPTTAFAVSYLEKYLVDGQVSLPVEE